MANNSYRAGFRTGFAIGATVGYVCGYVDGYRDGQESKLPPDAEMHLRIERTWWEIQEEQKRRLDLQNAAWELEWALKQGS